MNRFLSKSQKINVLKIAFSLVLLVSLAIGFQNFTNKHEFSQILQTMGSPWYLISIFGLLFFNIYAESRKWRALHTTSIHSLVAIRAVLAGYSTATLSPNRVAEFAGRSAIFPERIRPELNTATFIGSFIQGAVTVGFGLLSLFVVPFGAGFIRRLNFESIAWLMGLCLLVFFGIYLFRTKISAQLSDYFKALKKLSLDQVMKAFLWAVFRYVVFLFQFYLALLLFGFEGSFLIAATGISCMYMVQSYIPLSGLGELGVREFLCFTIFGSYMSIASAAFFPALVIWVINIALPSLTGLIMLKTHLHFAR